MNAVVVIMSLGIVVVLAMMICAVVGVIYLVGRNRKQFQKRSLESEKIEKMLSQGKITPEEASELNKAIGISVLPLELKMDDKHIKTLSMLEMIYAGLQILVAGVMLIFVLLVGVGSTRSGQHAKNPANKPELGHFDVASLSEMRGESKALSFGAQFEPADGSPLPVPRSVIIGKIQNRQATMAAGVYAFLGIITVFILAIFLLRLIASFKLRKGSKAAKIIILILSVLDLASFPIGTLIGGYAIWVLLFRDGAEEYYQALSDIN